MWPLHRVHLWRLLWQCVRHRSHVKRAILTMARTQRLALGWVVVLSLKRSASLSEPNKLARVLLSIEDETLTSGKA